MGALAIVEPMSPLATRSLTKLPGWVTEQWRTISKWKTETSVTLRSATTLTAEQRDMIESARSLLVKQLDQTPKKYPQYEQEMLNELGELILSRPHRDDELRSEAIVRSFGYALEDVPVWATLRAIRNWHRDKVKSWDDPEKYDCKWCPSPIELSRIAKRYAKEVRDRVEHFDDILRATPDGATYPLHRPKVDRDNVGLRSIGTILANITL